MNTTAWKVTGWAFAAAAGACALIPNPYPIEGFFILGFVAFAILVNA